MSNDYRQRMLAIADELSEQGVGRYASAPPIYRLAWRLGFRIRPPHYQSFASLTLGSAAWFGLTWGLVMWFMDWQYKQMPVAAALVASAAAGLFFGLMMAAIYRWKAHRLHLPPLDGPSAET